MDQKENHTLRRLRKGETARVVLQAGCVACCVACTRLNGYIIDSRSPDVMSAHATVRPNQPIDIEAHD